MKSTVVNLNPSRLHESVPPFLTMLGAGPGIRNALRVLLPRLPKDQQRALLTVVAFRLMGAQLPADFTLLSHLPMLAGLHDQTLAAAFQMLVQSGHLDVNQEAMTFFWPQLEALFDGQVALEETLAKEAIERLTAAGPDQPGADAEVVDAEWPWCLHLRGPDEVHAAPSKAAAEAAAAYVTTRLDTHPEVKLAAVAAPWPHSLESHAEDLKNWDQFAPPTEPDPQ